MLTYSLALLLVSISHTRKQTHIHTPALSGYLARIHFLTVRQHHSNVGVNDTLPEACLSSKPSSTVSCSPLQFWATLAIWPVQVSITIFHLNDSQTLDKRCCWVHPVHWKKLSVLCWGMVERLARLAKLLLRKELWRADFAIDGHWPSSHNFGVQKVFVFFCASCLPVVVTGLLWWFILLAEDNDVSSSCPESMAGTLSIAPYMTTLGRKP